jgi:hypothetical protein
MVKSARDIEFFDSNGAYFLAFEMKKENKVFYDI